jgi:hypothetical protein
LKCRTRTRRHYALRVRRWLQEVRRGKGRGAWLMRKRGLSQHVGAIFSPLCLPYLASSLSEPVSSTYPLPFSLALTISINPPGPSNPPRPPPTSQTPTQKTLTLHPPKIPPSTVWMLPPSPCKNPTNHPPGSIVALVRGQRSIRVAMARFDV